MRCAAMVVLLALTAPFAVAQPGPIGMSTRQIVADSIDARDVEISRFGTYVALYDTTEGNSVRLFDRDLNQLWRHRLRLYWAGSLRQGSIIQFAPDESFVLFPSYRTEEDVCVCDPETGEPIDVLRHHESGVQALALSPDGSRLVTASHDELVLWERSKASFEVVDTWRGYEPSIHSIEFLPDNAHFVMSTTRENVFRAVLLVGTDDRRIVELARHEFEDRNISNDIDQLAVSPDGGTVAAGYRDSLLFFAVDGVELRLDRRVDGIDLGAVYTLAFAPDGATLASGHFGFVRWWKRAEGSHSAAWVEAATTPTQQPLPHDIEIASSGRELLLASRADENALARYELAGVGASALGRIVDALDGRLSSAGRRVLDDALARELLAGLPSAALDARDMFETQQEYEDRVMRARAVIRARLLDEIEAAYGARRLSNDAAIYDTEVALATQGSYDIDRRRYTVRVLDEDGWLALERDTARSLYERWTDARVRATRFATDSGADYADFRLVHPVDGIEYPVVFEQNPYTGARLDAARSLVPAIAVGPDVVLSDLEIEAIFPTLYPSYAIHPIGRFHVENVGSGILSDLRVEFSIEGLTGPEHVVDVPASLASQQRVEAVLTAPVSSAVLEATEGGTATLRLSVSYRRLGTSHRETVTRQVRYLNRNAIQWSDDRRIGAFMSVSRPDVLGWAGQVAGAVETQPTPVLTRNFLYAVQIFESLRLAGIEYVVDPNSAYQRLSVDETAVDYLRFPMETITHGAGDCDDLSVLYATMLEAVGVPTAFITTPGHIFVAVDSGIDPRAVDRAFASAENVIVRDGVTWLPVETTVLTEGFVRAWQVGGLQWRQAHAKGTAGFFTAQEAWSEYSPVGVPTVGSAPRPDTPSTRTAARAELASFRSLELDPKLSALRSQTDDPDDPRAPNREGVLYASYGLLDEAAGSFRAALARDDYVPAMINLANVLSIAGDHDEARALLERAREREPENARILMGLAFSFWETGDRDEARSRWEVASRVSPSLARRYPLFSEAAEATGARAGVGESIFAKDWVEK